MKCEECTNLYDYLNYELNKFEEELKQVPIKSQEVKNDNR